MLCWRAGIPHGRECGVSWGRVMFKQQHCLGNDVVVFERSAGINRTDTHKPPILKCNATFVNLCYCEVVVFSYTKCSLCV